MPARRVARADPGLVVLEQGLAFYIKFVFENVGASDSSICDHETPFLFLFQDLAVVAMETRIDAV